MNKLLTRIGIGIGVMFLLNGCAHKTTNLSPTKYNMLRGKTISLVPLDTLTHPKDGNIGGLFLDTNLLSAILNNISDNMMTHPEYLYPTGMLGSRSVNLLIKKYDMVLKPSDQQTDYKLEVKTYWYYKGVTLKWQKAKIYMENDIRLKDTKGDKVIAQAFCEYNPYKVKDIPMYDYSEIRNAKSKAVRDEATKAIDLCIKKLKTEVLK